MTLSGNDLAAQRFGAWLSAELKARHSSGPKLAKALGLGRPTVYRWTSGTFRPRAAQCQAIAAALGVEHDLVLAMAGFRTYDLTVEGAVRRQLVELLADIPEELLIPLVPMLRALAEPATQHDITTAIRERAGDA